MTEPDLDTVELTVITPTFNEGRHVEELLDSLVHQALDVPFEVLVVDGRSTDDTRAKVEARIQLQETRQAAGERCATVRLLDNEARRTPFAFNIGLTAARGRYVAILGAHARYDRNYLQACLDEVRAAPATTACGGLVRTVPAGDGFGARLVVAVLLNPFASSTRSFRTVTPGPVDSISFPVVGRQQLLDLGGYDERLTRNQDNDMNERMRRSGVSLRVTGATGADYVAAATPGLLLRYAWRNGWWSTRSALFASSRMHLRYFAPAAFAAGTVGAAATAVAAPAPLLRRAAAVGLAAAWVSHLAIGGATASRGTTLKGAERALVPPTIVAFHLAYGFGTIASLAAFALKWPVREFAGGIR